MDSTNNNPLPIQQHNPPNDACGFNEEDECLEVENHNLFQNNEYLMPIEENPLLEATEEASHRRSKSVDDQLLHNIEDSELDQHTFSKSHNENRIVIRRSSRIAADAYVHRLL